MMKSLACGMALTLFLQLIQSKIDLLSISDRLCLSALIFCTVSAIGISVKSHRCISNTHTCTLWQNESDYKNIFTFDL